MPVQAFDQNETIMGQGTLGLELEQQAPDIDTVLVAVGGGGLIAGIAAWYAGRIKVIGVEPFASPTLTKALEAGHPVDAEAGGLAADSLAPRRVGERVFPIVQKYAPRTVLVSDDAIAEAQATLWRALRIVAEPGGAAAFSAILSGAYRPHAGERRRHHQRRQYRGGGFCHHLVTAPAALNRAAVALLRAVEMGVEGRGHAAHQEAGIRPLTASDVPSSSTTPSEISILQPRRRPQHGFRRQRRAARRSDRDRR